MSTSRKTSYHHGDLRTALIEAALDILEEGTGPAALSLREAARRVGVSAMAPYRHFADKDALLAAVATVGFERLVAAQRDAERESDPKTALKAQGVAYVAFACANPALFRLMFGRGAPVKTDSLGKVADTSFALLFKRVESVGAVDRTMDYVLLSWSMMHGLAMLAVDGQLKPFGDATPVELAERMAGLVAYGGR